jgi:branched-chain amino acid transport system substrate-binding protein
MIPLFEKAGFTVFDPGGYEDGTADYSTQIGKYKAAGVQIFTGVPIPPDFATFWRQAAQQGLAKTIKIQSIAKTGLFPSQMEALGSLAYNIASLCYWHPTFPYKSPLTGGTSQELADGYEKSSGKQWNQQLGATQSLLDVGSDLLKTTANPTDKADVAKTLSHLKTTTAVGVVEFGKFPIPNVWPTPLIGAQWIKAKPGSKYKFDLVIVDNADDPNVPIGAKLQPYS